MFPTKQIKSIHIFYKQQQHQKNLKKYSQIFNYSSDILIIIANAFGFFFDFFRRHGFNFNSIWMHYTRRYGDDDNDNDDVVEYEKVAHQDYHHQHLYLHLHLLLILQQSLRPKLGPVVAKEKPLRVFSHSSYSSHGESRL